MKILFQTSIFKTILCIGVTSFANQKLIPIDMSFSDITECFIKERSRDYSPGKLTLQKFFNDERDTIFYIEARTQHKYDVYRFGNKESNVFKTHREAAIGLALLRHQNICPQSN